MNRMNDTIYRQDAIELAMQYCPDDDGTCSKADEDIRNLLDELEDLPSAQPELNEWCHDCKEYDKEHHCCPRWNRVIKTTLADVHSEQQWIPCGERLPEYDMCRTLTTINTHVKSGYYYKGLFYNDNGDTWKATDKEVIAWMPLPEPWKGEEQ